MLTFQFLLIIMFISTLIMYSRNQFGDYKFILFLLTFFMIIGVILNAIIKHATKMTFYIFPLLFVAMALAPTISFRFIFPYVISPRRFYAGLFGIDKDPWAPPREITMTFLTHFCLIVYLFMVSYIVIQLLSLRRLGVCHKNIAIKYALKLTIINYIIFLICRSSTLLGGTIDMVTFWIPFADDMIVALPMAFASTFLMIFRFQDEIMKETSGRPLQLSTTWDRYLL